MYQSVETQSFENIVVKIEKSFRGKQFQMPAFHIVIASIKISVLSVFIDF